MAFKKHENHATTGEVKSTRPEETESTPPAAPVPDAHILWGDEQLIVTSLPEHARHYLMQQGAIKVRSDVAGGLPKAHREEGKTKEESDAIIAGKHAERLRAILAGTTVTRALGPRLVGLERMLRVVARERVLDKAARMNKEPPKGKAMLDIVEMLIKADPKVRQIAELRMDDDGEADFPTL